MACGCQKGAVRRSSTTATVTPAKAGKSGNATIHKSAPTPARRTV